MVKMVKVLPELVRVADELESEMARLEGVSRSACKISLSSGKDIARAAAQLDEAMTMPARLAECLKAVATALGGLQERQQAALEPLTVLAAEVQRRARLMQEHMERFALLGRAAGELSAQIATNEVERATVAAAEARLKELSDEARALFEAARDDDFPEIAREADVLKQRLSSIRKRLTPGGSTA